MADNTSLLQQQQAAQAAQQAQQAQKAAKPETKAPQVQFSEVMKNAQKKKGDATVTVLNNNPVAGSEVVKNSTGTTAKGKLAVAPNANTGSGSSSTVNNNASSTSTSSTGGDSVVSSADNSSQQMINASYQMQEMNQDFNMQYLNLQEGMQADSRQYTALSNVSKTRSDTAKNSLSNVK